MAKYKATLLVTTYFDCDDENEVNSNFCEEINDLIDGGHLDEYITIKKLKSKKEEDNG